MQTWKTKNLTGKMAEIVHTTKTTNPEYLHELYDDNDCIAFLSEYYGQNYVNAFKALKPGAFRADFFRYAYLYINGGIYMDIDMVPLVPMRDIVYGPYDLISVSDIQHKFVPTCNIFQAFIACKPRHPIMKYATELSFANIVTRRTEMFDNFSITGPVVMGVAVNLYWGKQKTHQRIIAGVYDIKGARLPSIPDTSVYAGPFIKLFDMTDQYTYDLDKDGSRGKPIFLNKFSEYKRGPTNYATVAAYHDDPRMGYKRNLWASIVIGIGVIIIIILLLYIYYIRLKKCKETCSGNDNS
jgi:hypothetical protein